MNKHVIPLVLVAFDAIEAIVCACQRDWPRSLYWASAASITFSTILMK